MCIRDSITTVQQNLLDLWASVDSTGTVTALSAASSTIYRAQRAHDDGAAGLQRALSLVRRTEYGRPDLGRDRVYQESHAVPRWRDRRQILFGRSREGTRGGPAERGAFYG